MSDSIAQDVLLIMVYNAQTKLIGTIELFKEELIHVEKGNYTRDMLRACQTKRDNVRQHNAN